MTISWQRKVGYLPNSWDLEGGPLPLLCSQWGLGMGRSCRGGEQQPPLRDQQNLQSPGHTPLSAALEGQCVWSGAIFPWRDQAQPSIAALTNGFTALVSINEGHDGAQGHIWVIPNVLQVADGILDVLCKERPRGYALGLQAPWHIHGGSY